MAPKIRLTIMSLLLLAAVIFNLFATVPALADDEAPPPPDSPAAAESGAGFTAQVPIDQSAAPSPSDSLPVPAPGEESASIVDDSSDQELLPPLAQGTDVVVLDEAGEVVPLATQAAAEIIASGDPIWCPSSVAVPTAGLGGCTISYGTFALLLTDPVFGALGPAVDGTIWIEKTYAGADPTTITINGATLLNTSMKDFKLTLKGGWNGSGFSTIDMSTPSVFNDRLNVLNWNNDVTLSDIEINATSGGTEALHITTTKNISLTRVNSHNNGTRGATLDNTSGNGKVTITSSQFNNNGAGGLYVSSDGSVTLSTATSSGNLGGDGAYLTNSSPLGVILIGTNTFDNNFYTGLTISTGGAIAGHDISASGNGTSGTSGFGAWLMNNGASTPQPVTLTGSNIFNENYSDGLYITSIGAVKLNNVTANSNAAGMGVDLYNNGGSTAQPVTFTGTNSFKFNQGYGLYLNSKGAITLNNITANSALSSQGAWLNNNFGGFGSAVNLTGNNFFNDNFAEGLVVNSLGSISAVNLSANGNGLGLLSGVGANLSNVSAVTPKSITLSGTSTFSGNYGGGLYVNSVGAIVINKLNASGNVHGYGANLDNHLAVAAQPIKLTGVNTVSDNYSYGLNVYSVGAISINSVDASRNGLLGFSGQGIYLTNNGSLAPQGITLTGINKASDNYQTGLSANSLGIIKINSLNASGNGVLGLSGSGAQISNNYLSSTAGVTFTGTNVFNGNYFYGLVVDSPGTVALNSINSSGNMQGHGLVVDNTYSGTATPKNITLSGTSIFNDNYVSGLVFATYGAVTMSNVTATGNGSTSGFGAYITNSSATLAKGVTLTGTNHFDHNYDNGLFVSTLGAIKASNLNVNGNGSSGASLNNGSGAALPGVTLTGVNTFKDNWTHGLLVSSAGTVAVSNLTATGNGIGGGFGYGASIDNTAGSTTKSVTLSGVNVFDGNKSSGVAISSSGAITVSNLTASNTLSGMGANLDNASGPSTAGITLTGAGNFNNNSASGFYAVSFGTISLNTITLTANLNGFGGSGSGVELWNASAATPKAVTLKGVNTMLKNHSGGLKVDSAGAITANNVTAGGTIAGYGARLKNNYGSGAPGITLTGSNTFDSSAQDGLIVVSFGAITANNLSVNSNGTAITYGGATLDNSTAATPQPVKLTGSNVFNGNNTYGLFISSSGAITTNNVSASDNATSLGAQLLNNPFGGTSPVTMTGTNFFNNNSSHGLEVDSNGVVSVNNVNASNNGASTIGYGVLIDNHNASTPQAVKVTGTSIFNSDYSGGLQISSKGAVTLNNLTANSSTTGTGVHVVNNFGTADVTLTGYGTFVGNNQTGLSILSLGNVSLTKVTGDGNGLHGLVVDAGGNVTLTCGSLIANTVYGWSVSTPATLKLIGVVSAGNGLSNTHFVGGTLVVTYSCPLP